MTVIVFGSINVDHVAYAQRLPSPGETILGEYQMFPGGKGCNQAIASQRVGADTAMIAAVGDDNAGRYMMDFLSNEGVSSKGVQFVDAPTGVALIYVDSHSQNSIVVCPGANQFAELLDTAMDSIGVGDIILGQGETDTQKLFEAMKFAKSKGCKTILNPAPYFSLDSEFQAAVDILIFNEIEFSQFVSAPSVLGEIEISNRLLEFTTTTILVTLGGSGVLVSEHGQVTKISGEKVDAVDTTGAGDCFCGTFSARISLGDSHVNAAKIANKAAAISVTRKGAASSMPTMREIGIG